MRHREYFSSSYFAAGVHSLCVLLTGFFFSQSGALILVVMGCLDTGYDLVPHLAVIIPRPSHVPLYIYIMFAFFITSLGSRFTHSSRLAHFSYPAVSIFASTFTIPISSASPALLSLQILHIGRILSGFFVSRYCRVSSVPYSLYRVDVQELKYPRGHQYPSYRFSFLFIRVF